MDITADERSAHGPVATRCKKNKALLKTDAGEHNYNNIIASSGEGVNIISYSIWQGDEILQRLLKLTCIVLWQE